MCPGITQLFLENMNGAKGRLREKNISYTFVLTAFTILGRFNNFPPLDTFWTVMGKKKQIRRTQCQFNVFHLGMTLGIKG